MDILNIFHGFLINDLMNLIYCFYTQIKSCIIGYFSLLAFHDLVPVPTPNAFNIVSSIGCWQRLALDLLPYLISDLAHELILCLIVGVACVIRLCHLSYLRE